MIFYCNPNFDKTFLNEIGKASNLFDGLIYYFQNKNFGKSINEIVFIMLAGDEDYLQHYGIGRNYRKRKAVYGSIFLVDCIKIQHLPDKELFKYLGNAVIEEAKHIKEKGIPDFDCDMFIDHLVQYFEYAIPAVLEGKNLAEGETLNEDIKEVMRQKFLKL